LSHLSLEELERDLLAMMLLASAGFERHAVREISIDMVSLIEVL